MGRTKGSVNGPEHRARIAAAQRRRHAARDRTPVECAVCGQVCAGPLGLAVHTGKSHPPGDE